jgi:hypothetical protein
VGTTAEPENLTNPAVEPERAHYFEVGSAHAIGDSVTVELTDFYKLSKNFLMPVNLEPLRFSIILPLSEAGNEGSISV